MSSLTHLIPEVIKNVAVIRVEGISTNWHQYVVDIDPVPVDQPLRLVVWLRDTKENITPTAVWADRLAAAKWPTESKLSVKVKSEIAITNDAENVDTTLVVDNANMDYKTTEVVIKETKENLFDIANLTNLPGQPAVVYHAEPCRLLNRSHRPEGWSGPRVIKDWGVTPVFPPKFPTYEEFCEMFPDRAVFDDENDDKNETPNGD